MEFPGEIIHCILKFLRGMEGSRTMLVSKAWKTAWDSRPVLDFRNYGDVSEFAQCLEACLHSYTEKGLSVERFRLWWDGAPRRDVISRWIQFLVNSNIGVLDLHISDLQADYFLGILSSKTLTALSLSGMGVKLVPNDGHDWEFPSMKCLCMDSVAVDDDGAVVGELIAACPLLEELNLTNCQGLAILEISSHLGIRTIHLEYLPGLSWIDVGAPSLESFSYLGTDSQFLCEIKLELCEATLRNLRLKRTSIESEWLRTQISRFDALEVLVLEDVLGEHGPSTLKVTSSKLIELIITDCNLEEDTEIYAPNLRELVCVWNKFPFYSLVASSLPMSATIIFELDKKCGGHGLETIWLLKLKELFQEVSLKTNFVVTLILDNKFVILDEGWCVDSFLPILEDLRESMPSIIVEISSADEYWKDFFIDPKTRNILVTSSLIDNLSKYVSENCDKSDDWANPSKLKSFRIESLNDWRDLEGDADTNLALSKAFSGSPFSFTRFSFSWF